MIKPTGHLVARAALLISACSFLLNVKMQMQRLYREIATSRTSPATPEAEFLKYHLDETGSGSDQSNPNQLLPFLSGSASPPSEAAAGEVLREFSEEPVIITTTEMISRHPKDMLTTIRPSFSKTTTKTDKVKTAVRSNRLPLPTEHNETIRNSSYHIQKNPSYILGNSSYPVVNSQNDTFSIQEDLLLDPVSVSKFVADANSQLQIRNLARFGAINDSTFVIVIQVHNRSQYLEALVHSLEKVSGIENVLLIFSHDLVQPEINQIVQAIDFCKVLQIFYPNSPQMAPLKFPGEDPKDCAPRIGVKDRQRNFRAEKQKCQNWQTPDKYGHYRSAALTQIKHHWWWKLNTVFDKLPLLLKFQKNVLFLEEDNVVTPDILHVLNFISSNKQNLCADCSIISLGSHIRNLISYGFTMSQLTISPWFSGLHNIGMAFNRDTFNLIKECYKAFCTYDDYNWDWSLMYINNHCLSSQMKVLFPQSPRVFHIGDCGVHHKGNDCSLSASQKAVKETLQNWQAQFFPGKMAVAERTERRRRPAIPSGGWGDPRDHHLCLQNGGKVGSWKLSDFL